MKSSLKIAFFTLSITILASACHHAAKTQSSTDSVITDSAQRDGTQVDTEQVDTNHKGSAHMQGDGHPRGGMY